MNNYFQGNKKHPQHISVGAILLNDAKEVCIHHFTNPELLKGYWTEQGFTDFYLLMRETIEPNQTLEEALHKGLMEEFGATAKIMDYVGSIQSHFLDGTTMVEKTTLYFMCKLKKQDTSKRSGDIESKTELEWQTVDFLIPKMKEQYEKYKRDDVDESKILERIKSLI
ncbi:MAG: NUDIX hydrolase [Minisyncoccia bacterium]